MGSEFVPRRDPGRVGLSISCIRPAPGVHSCLGFAVVAAFYIRNSLHVLVSILKESHKGTGTEDLRVFTERADKKQIHGHAIESRYTSSIGKIRSPA